MFVTLFDKLSEAVHAAKAISFPQAPNLESFARGVEHGLLDALIISNTYEKETQAHCAGCGLLKPTPLRREEFGGYLCLACIDKRLDNYLVDKRINDAQKH